MGYVAVLLTLFLTIPAMCVELFRCRGAAKDGGTLEYVFEAGEQNSPNAVTKGKAAEIAADFVTTFYHVQGRRTGNAGAPDTACSILARLLFGRDQRTAATNVLCRPAAGWDGCCAERGQAAVVVGKRIGLERIVKSNGIKMHLSILGEGPLVILCHGFPDLWTLGGTSSRRWFGRNRSPEPRLSSGSPITA